ncbi:hypothetical protein [Pseudonocardia sp. T1-2H]|uniref:hypothetical protein n=1 Tax=Pseudonocardia sp. T1-2H TaxID=3128899 RepID=UPI003101AB1B
MSGRDDARERCGNRAASWLRKPAAGVAADAASASAARLSGRAGGASAAGLAGA